MAIIWGSRGTHLRESCYSFEGVMAHTWSWHTIWGSHATHLREPWHTFEGVLLYIWGSHGTNLVMARIWGSHGAHLREPCHTFEGVFVTSHKNIHSCMQNALVSHDMTQSSAALLILTWHDSFTYGSFSCDTTHSYAAAEHPWVSLASHIWGSQCYIA